jgi:hypothetical protein
MVKQQARSCTLSSDFLLDCLTDAPVLAAFLCGAGGGGLFGC